MTENIIENNKLIAEFMGMVRVKNEFCTGIEEMERFCINANLRFLDDHEDFPHLELEDFLKFHSDWNWLMPVVERIESMLHDDVITIEYKDCIIPVIAGSFNTDNDGFDIRVNGNSKIQAVFLACIQFINWYNQNKN